MSETYLEDAAEDLVRLVEAAARGLTEQERASGEVDAFIAQAGEVCGYLKSQIEATSVAKAGLEAILTSYSARYGQESEGMDDVIRFKAMLEEKEEKLSLFEEGMDKQAGEVADFLKDLEDRQAAVSQSLEEVEEALAGAKEARSASLDRLAQDQARVKELRDKFWSSAADEEEQRLRINLPPETLHSLVDDVVDRLQPEEAGREELISEILSSIRDQDLRQVLSEKLVDGPHS
jgi:chromosome segregation ATPase